MTFRSIGFFVFSDLGSRLGCPLAPLVAKVPNGGSPGDEGSRAHKQSRRRISLGTHRKCSEQDPLDGWYTSTIPILLSMVVNDDSAQIWFSFSVP